MKTALIGGVIGGALSAIPILNMLNCCFCLLNITGGAIGISMYLKEHPNENISNGDAAASGAISGAVAGLMAGIFGFLVNLALGSFLIEIYRSALPRDMARQLAASTAQGAAGIFVGPFLYAGFGALGGFLAMQLFFKTRLRNS
jgi:hypothetical protein